MKKIIAAVSLCSVLATSALADEGFYIGANAGQTSSDETGAKNPAAFTLQGGYRANENLAFEAQYGWFGNVAPIGSQKISGVSLAALGILPIKGRLSAFGKAGIASLDSKVSGSGIPGADGSYRKTALTYGIGGEFNFDPTFALRFGVDRYSTGGDNGNFILNNGTLTLVYVGVKYGN